MNVVESKTRKITFCVECSQEVLYQNVLKPGGHGNHGVLMCGCSITQQSAPYIFGSWRQAKWLLVLSE